MFPREMIKFFSNITIQKLLKTHHKILLLTKGFYINLPTNILLGIKRVEMFVILDHK